MTEGEYITNTPNKATRYLRILSIIDALEIQQLAVISNSDIEQYTLNDGQTVITTKYRSPDTIAKAINEYEKIAIRLHAQITGQRIMRLADAQDIQSLRNGRNI
jgi:hypothetical protein